MVTNPGARALRRSAYGRRAGASKRMRSCCVIWHAHPDQVAHTVGLQSYHLLAGMTLM